MSTEAIFESAFNAFEAQLRTLCLAEFPCGLGNWQGTAIRNNKKLQALELKNNRVNHRFTVTLKDYGAEHEKTELLEELVKVKSSPWRLDYSWSQEAKSLREIAVKSPWLISDQFILQHFKTLKIQDKGVKHVDKKLLNLKNLEELSLTANQLESIESNFLPQSLKVLELCANKISSLSDLCKSPPNLVHLGVGYNRLYSVEEYITGKYWPNLLSLDLCHNDLTNISDIIKKLQTLPRLKNLLLMGNPLCLCPAYRGYIIDSLERLSYLDDINITADERHYFIGFSKKKDQINLDECVVNLVVNSLQNIPMPDEIKNPDELPEYPIITRRYFVRFKYLKQEELSADVVHIEYHDQMSFPEISKTQNHGIDEVGNVQEQDTDGVKSNDSEEHLKNEPMCTKSPEVVDSIDKQQAGNKDTHPMGKNQEQKVELGDAFELAPIDSEKVQWNEDMECQWEQIVVRSEILKLRNFFKQGMDISVVEEKTESFPTEMLQEATGSQTPVDQKSEKSKKIKDTKDKRKWAKTGDDKKKKKKGEELDLTVMPATYRTIANFFFPLGELLDGETELNKQFSQEVQAEMRPVTPSSPDFKKDKKDKKHKQPGSAKKKKVGNNKSPKMEKKKDGKGKVGLPEPGQEEEELPAPPLQLMLTIKMEHNAAPLETLEETNIQQDQ